MNERGRLIVVEGIGGCGKDTQVELLRRYLVSQGSEVLVTREHTRDTPPGRLIERIIKRRAEEVGPVALQMLYVVDRINHTQRVLLPGLASHDVVLANRYRGSTVAYAPAGRRSYFMELQRPVTLEPDLVFLINLDPAEAARRVLNRKDGDIFDTEAGLRRCLEGYVWYAENSGDKVVWIDGGGTRQEVFGLVETEIKRRMYGQK